MKRAEEKPMLSHDEQPIVALCTPLGPGALALIRISGVGAIELADRLARCSSEKTLSDAPSHTIHHGYVIEPETNENIDEVMFLLMRTPRAYTGQDTVEITCHNNPMIIDRIIACAVNAGARPAHGGEFTQRALLNKKISLTQAEAVHEIITAHTQAALRRSLNQLQGSLAQHLARLEQLLVEIITLMEASFEFLEEEQRDLDFAQLVLEKVTQAHSELEALNRSAADEAKIRQGVRVALIGATNAGKSTLFNALLNKNRAIVSELEGTTRDSIEAGTIKSGLLWTIVDTAGLRASDNEVECEGISRTWAEARQADALMVVADASQPPSPATLQSYREIVEFHGEKVVFVINKCDVSLAHAKPFGMIIRREPILISAKTGFGVENLIEATSKTIQRHFEEQKAPFLLNKRHRSLITKLLRTIKEQIWERVVQGAEYETITCSLREALYSLSELSGKDVERKVLDEIFINFCVGK